MQTNGKRIRMEIDKTKDNIVQDINTSSNPHIWRGTDVVIDVAIFFGDPKLPATVLLDLANITSITLDVMPSIRNGTLIMTKTVAAAQINTALTQDDWDANTSQHASFVFAATETAPIIVQGLFTDYHMVVSCITTGGAKDTLGISVLRIEEDGSGNETTPEIGDPTYLTAPQTLAAIAIPFVDQIMLFNQTTGLYHPVQLIGSGNAISPISGATGVAHP